jgi:hypothetical protein
MSKPAAVVSTAQLEVVEALGRLERSERNALEEFRTALCVFIGSLRAQGMDRDTVAETVRALVAVPTTDNVRGLHPSAREALIELSIHWCAEEFSRES